MAKGQTTGFNRLLLNWALEESGYSIDRVAKRLNVKPERIELWETGKLQPTLRQVEKLARLFHRPLSVFFLPRPPLLPPLAAEYRRLPDVDPGQESPELRLALRQMLARRETALNLMIELGEVVPDFPLRARLNEAPAAVGQRLRLATGVSVDAQLNWASEWQAWRAWRSAAEQLGMFVYQFSKVSLREVRGLALLRMPMPVAAVNGKEMPEARAFTLYHEIIHIMLAAGQEEVPAANEKRSEEEWLKVERFAEIAASHVLVPETALHAMLDQLNLKVAQWDIERVRRVARKFRLTPLAIATRLRESGFMTWGQYKAWREQWDAYVAKLPPRKGGFATPTDKAINRVGFPFAQLVLQAMSANRITSVDASRYLDLKFQHFDMLRMRLTGSVEESASDE